MRGPQCGPGQISRSPNLINSLAELSGTALVIVLYVLSCKLRKIPIDLSMPEGHGLCAVGLHDVYVGCQYCVQACPYGARYFNAEKGVSDKCTWCYYRITKGLQPACVEVCPVGARIFGDRKYPQSPIKQFIRDNQVQVLKRETGNSPNVFYVGIDKEVSRWNRFSTLPRSPATSIPTRRLSPG